MFPSDAITSYYEFTTAGTHIFENTTTPKTVLMISMDNQLVTGAPNPTAVSIIYCGSTAIKMPVGTNYVPHAMNFVCPAPLSMTVTGTGLMPYAVVTYVMRNRNTTPDTNGTVSFPSSISATTTFSPDLNQAFHDSTTAFLLVAMLCLFVIFWILGKSIFKFR